MSFEMSEEEINELLETGMASADAALTALNLNQAAKPDSGHLNDHNYTKLNPNQPQKIPIMVQEPQIERKIAQPLYPSLTGTEPNDQPKFTMVSSAPQTGLILSGPEKPPAAPTSRSDDLTSMAKKNLLSQNQDPMWSSTNPAGNKGSAPFKRGKPFRGCTKARPPLYYGHRREYSISWVGGETTVLEWCNPVCSPIKPVPSVEKCRCGFCPAKCELCI
uniref:V n=1 Tax=Eptesicus fuscus orthorubulavirus TaxID=2884705 RepID=A0A8K1NFB5_9MONO|nr:V [Eptesicus fuscus orthorubulavirus] [Eptesicus fuscus orthorubulavirus]